MSRLGNLFRPYWDWLCCAPLLLAGAFLTVALVTGWVASGFGVMYLFWHADRSTQLAAGAAVTLLLGEIGFVGYLLDLRRSDEAPPKRTLNHYLALTWLPPMVVVLIPAFAKLESYQAPDRPSSAYLDLWTLEAPAEQMDGQKARPATQLAVVWALGRRWPFLLGCAGAVAVLWLVIQLNRVIRGIPKPPALTPDQLHHRATWFFSLLLILYAMLYIGSFLPLVGDYLSPAVGICTVLGLLTASYGYMLHAFPGRWYPLTAGLILLALLCSLQDHKHILPGLESYYPSGDETKKAGAKTWELANYETTRTSRDLLDDNDVLNAWLKNQIKRSRQGKPPLVIVTTSGGGIAAAEWTVVVLTRLEEEIPGFTSHIRIICGASGGMVGAAYYVAAYDRLHALEEELASGKIRSDEYETNRQDILRQIRARMADAARTSLTQVGRYAVLRDLPGLYWPFAYREDRGWALEKAWKKSLENKLETPFRELTKDEQAGWRPSLVFSPMLVEDGRRLLISNLDLNWMVETTAPTLDGKNPAGSRLSVSGVEFFKLFPNAGLKLATAARINAAFPYVSPVTTIPTNPPRRVVDAGYYDNYGLAVATAWVAHHTNFILQNQTPIWLIQIRAYANQADRSRWVLKTESDQRGVGLPNLAQGAEGLTTPAQGVLEARNAFQMYRSDEFVTLLARYINTVQSASESPLWLVAQRVGAKADPDKFKQQSTPAKLLFDTAFLECPTQISLSWYLTPDEIQALEDGIPPIGAPDTGNPIWEHNQEILKALKRRLNQP